MADGGVVDEGVGGTTAVAGREGVAGGVGIAVPADTEGGQHHEPPHRRGVGYGVRGAGEGFVGIVDDADAGTKVYLCTVSKAAWWYIELKEAV
jgi:hypothetical protein